MSFFVKITIRVLSSYQTENTDVPIRKTYIVRGNFICVGEHICLFKLNIVLLINNSTFKSAQTMCEVSNNNFRTLWWNNVSLI